MVNRSAPLIKTIMADVQSVHMVVTHQVDGGTKIVFTLISTITMEVVMALFHLISLNILAHHLLK